MYKHVKEESYEALLGVCNRTSCLSVLLGHVNKKKKKERKTEKKKKKKVAQDYAFPCSKKTMCGHASTLPYRLHTPLLALSLLRSVNHHHHPPPTTPVCCLPCQPKECSRVPSRRLHAQIESALSLDTFTHVPNFIVITI